ncbi:hypothetical protein K227x_46030 [Rubripirellula lacrimiformis]|uniref:DUF1549 domain-containing protein n=1 Tax=Rubripirellula lacrimiformis TaxID=1930273 RepID=A0A517NGD1_9BACT|nr:hypothetical protein [Rubripirellula lacrimiformis]QDT06195.1 hypothetical protein K227x_46030 [Rubripirellula lacrimiformis]
MTNANQPDPQRSTDSRSGDSPADAFDERAFDALLAEAMGGAEPPDLTAQILARLNQDPTPAPAVEPPPIHAAVVRSGQSSAPVMGDGPTQPPIQPIDADAANSTWRRRVRLAAVLAALAASVVAVVWLRPDAVRPLEIDGLDIAAAPSAPGSDSGNPNLADTSSPDSRIAGPNSIDPNSIDPNSPDPQPAVQSPEPGSIDPPAASDAIAQSRPPRGIPMVLDIPNDGSTGDGNPNQDGRGSLSPSVSDIATNSDTATNRTIAADRSAHPDASEPKALSPLRLVSRQTDTQMRSYWDAIGIQPATAAEQPEVLARFNAATGIDFQPDDLADADAIQARLAGPQAARQVAKRWLGDVTEGGLGRIDADAQSRLVDAAAGVFAGKTSGDELLTRWFSGESEDSSSFYSAMAHASKSLADGALARRLASLSMDADLRCTRCHDAYIEGSGQQQDYWSLMALLQRDLVSAKGRKGVWSVAKSASSKPVFFDLPDGRRRLAEPAVAAAWIGSDQPALSLGQWADRLKDSDALASGLVNSIWKMVHGQPLRGRVVDPMSAPHNEALQSLERELTDDLRRSNFDLGRTLALVLASPATNREVPDSLKNAWVIDNAADRSAAEAFAAAVPARSNLSLNRRLDETMRAIGAKLDGDGNPLLAQLGDSSKGNGKGKTRQADRLSWDFPDRAESLPVQWLVPMDDLADRVNHLGYLGGMTELPKSILAAADAMQAAGVDDATLLNRVWWLVRQ